MTYDALQRLAQVAYPDGSALTQVGRDKAERVVSQQWSAGGQVVSDAVVRSQSGRRVELSHVLEPFVLRDWLRRTGKGYPHCTLGRRPMALRLATRSWVSSQEVLW